MPKVSAASKKRKVDDDANAEVCANKKTKSISKESSVSTGTSYDPLTLESIKSSIIKLCDQVPVIPNDGIDDDFVAVREWAEGLQAAIEEFSLLLNCVSSATYKWGSDRSGASAQSHSVITNELNSAQDKISSACSNRLTNVLAPVVDLVVSKVITSKEEGTGNEIKTNVYKSEVVDPDFLKLSCSILRRNARMMRQVVLESLNKSAKVITDYQKASKKENQNDRSFAY